LLCISLFYTVYIDYCVKSKVGPRIKLDDVSPRKQDDKRKDLNNGNKPLELNNKSIDLQV